MGVVNFLEKKWVIKFFGLALILAPFINIVIHYFYLKSLNNPILGQVDFFYFIKNGSIPNYILSICSLVIGFKMLNGSQTSWKYVLILVGSHMLIQISNYKSPIWQGAMAWVTFTFNLAIFLFIADQLVWKQSSSNQFESNKKANDLAIKKTSVCNVLNLYSHKKILFSFGQKPWGKLKSFNHQELVVDSFSKMPENFFKNKIEINFVRGLKLDIVYDRTEKNLVYFKPIEMNKDKIQKINNWFKEIAI